MFSEGVSIKQHAELAWREDSQAVGWIRCEGVCSGTDSTWSFSSVWIYIYYIKKGISYMELNWLCQRVWICWHISRCCITLLSYCVSSGLGASDCEIKPDVLVCSFFFLSLRRLRDCPTLFPLLTHLVFSWPHLLVVAGQCEGWYEDGMSVTSFYLQRHLWWADISYCTYFKYLFVVIYPCLRKNVKT